MTNSPDSPGNPPPLPNQTNYEQYQQQQQQQWQRQAPPPPPNYYPPHSYSYERPSKGSTFLQSCLVAGCATILAPIFLLIAFVVFLGYSFSSFDSSTFESTSSPLFQEKNLRKGEAGKGKIVVINLRGQIDGQGSDLEGTGMIGMICEQLKVAEEDENVKAILLQVDSPGGGLTPSDIIYNKILNVRAEGKVVVSWAGGLMTSGGYYIAAASDAIVASPTATVGSLGVILQRFQVDGFMDKLGLKADPIMAGESKDIGSPFRDMTPEERQLLQRNVDHAHDRFIGIVAKGRGMSREAVVALADGKLFSADESVQNGLVDDIGYIDDAIAMVEELVGSSDMRVVGYSKVFSFADVLGGSSRSFQTLFKAINKQTDTTPKMISEWTGE